MIEAIRGLITDKISGEWGDEATPENGVKVIRTANFTNLGVINYDNIVYRNIDAKKIDQKKLFRGDIIIEKSGGSPTQPVGRVVFFDPDTDDTYLCNNFTAILRPDTAKVYPKFLFYQMYMGHIRGRTLKYQNKTTGIINLKLDQYLEEPINVPSIEEQIAIANVLSKAETLIKQRKESIALLDEFLKSTFLKMFGDPVRNEKGWETERLGKSIKIKHGFAFKSEFFSSEGKFVLLTPGNFNEEGGYKDRGEKQKFYSGEIPEDYVLSYRALLIAMTEQAPGLLGSPIIVPEADKFLHNQRLGLVNFSKNEFDEYFLFYFFSSKVIKNEIHLRATGTKVRHTSPSKIEELNIYHPPIDLQNQFGKIVEMAEVIKGQYRASLLELENLYGSLSLRAFGREQKEDKRYGDPFDIDEETARAQGEDFYRLWAEVHNKNVEHQNLQQSIDYAVESNKLKNKAGMKKVFLTFAGNTQVPFDKEHLEKSAETRDQKYGIEQSLRINGEKGITWATVSKEEIADWLKKRFADFHFTTEMAVQFLTKQLDTVGYYSSEELKRNPKTNEAEDFKAFIFSALSGSNPFIRLEQKFYDMQKENFPLRLNSEDFEQVKGKDASGIYFSILP